VRRGTVKDVDIGKGRGVGASKLGREKGEERLRAQRKDRFFFQRLLTGKTKR